VNKLKKNKTRWRSTRRMKGDETGGRVGEDKE
jgi:hypothetical protein